MTLKSVLIKFSLLITLAIASGCASVQRAAPELDAAAKNFIPNSEYAQVYVYRDQTFGAALSLPVSVDGKVAGNTGPKSFFKFDLPEGKHTFGSQGEKSILGLTVEKGKIYFIWQKIKLGMVSGGSELLEVDAEKGKKGVRKSKLIEMANSE